MKKFFCAFLVSLLPSLVLAELTCRDDFEDKICDLVNSDNCDPIIADFYADTLLEILETAHPTIQRLACDIERYEIRDLGEIAGQYKY